MNSPDRSFVSLFEYETALSDDKSGVRTLNSLEGNPSLIWIDLFKFQEIIVCNQYMVLIIEPIIDRTYEIHVIRVL